MSNLTMYMIFPCDSKDELNRIEGRLAKFDGIEAIENSSPILEHCLRIKYAHDKVDAFYNQMLELGFDQDEIGTRLVQYAKALNESEV